MQIFVSFFDLLFIFFKNIFFEQKFYYNINNTFNFDMICEECNNNYFSVNKKSLTCLVCNNEKN